ncbi:hypothetical protein MKX01_000342 [Papaver californicum]|nr:hypothetical protein MKX01_000342 [Papaver californicum]
MRSHKWAKAIQQDWRLLEKDLPDTIYVRAYQERMNLLRAVTVEYPDTPPLVNYHAHNLRINPNLYANGYVCLSLLNTWQGSSVERWTPGTSTMLQVLLTIQVLVLNEKPYFNEPGYANSRLPLYTKTFILSCRTMLYTLKNSPKYFEDYVLRHFRLRAYTILAACKAYIEVGATVEGVQDVYVGKKIGSSLYNFKIEVGTMAGNLVPIFISKGAKKL